MRRIIRPVKRPSLELGATEERLSFWREDPQLAEHHEHWHLVYPYAGRPDPKALHPDDIENPERTGPPYFAKPAKLLTFGDRRGELFAYMHQQMLARYDAERLSLFRVSHIRVKPLADYRQKILEGYDPGTRGRWIRNEAKDGYYGEIFSKRPRDAFIEDLTIPDHRNSKGATIDSLEQLRDQLLAAATRGVYVVNGRQVPVDIDNLGDTVEASKLSVDHEKYGELHNFGHIHLGHYNNDATQRGVMLEEETEVQDPVFYRWHKHIDSIFTNWQDAQGFHDFSDGPPVKIRKKVDPETGSFLSPDIILFLRSRLPVEFDGEELGRAVLGDSDSSGENNWDRDFSSRWVELPNGEWVETTDELRTELQERQIIAPVVRDGATVGTVRVPIEYLSHDDFYYFLRVENLANQPQTVTVRIFLAPETMAEDRSSWIEMDKFLYRLKGAERAVIFRPAELSSVVRKPALKPEDLALRSERKPSPKALKQSWCDCGWPYTLLLPRGTAKGRQFRLFVMFSDGEDLSMPEHPENCTSISYCGLQDEKYPDKREMGYPFNRPWGHSISSTIARRDNMAARTITIRHRDA
jgi:tyrosinase